jgi:hypothetical protein
VAHGKVGVDVLGSEATRNKMSLFERIYFTTFVLIGIAALVYWGYLAWFRPDKLKEKLMKRVERNPDWLFFGGYSLRFSEEYGIPMIRLITLVVALMLLLSGCLVALQLLRIIK